ncbi:VOC family protein, partial [Salmonella sp. s59878]
MRYLHAMVRVRDLDASLRFFRDGLGLVENRRREYPD